MVESREANGGNFRKASSTCFPKAVKHEANGAVPSVRQDDRMIDATVPSTVVVLMTLNELSAEQGGGDRARGQAHDD